MSDDALHLYGNDYDWFIAHSLEEAKQLCAEHYGDGDADFIEGEGWTEYADDASFTIAYSEADDLPAGTRPAGEWAKLAGKPGHLCGVEY